VNMQTWHKVDHYFIFRDFKDYMEAQNKVDEAYRDRICFARKCFKNMSNAGKFSSDRTIEGYTRDILHNPKASHTLKRRYPSFECI
jgi:starch phosphorylase